MKAKVIPYTQEEIKSLFDYNNGALYWKPREVVSKFIKTWNAKFAGKEVGAIHKSGYKQVKIHDIVYPLHRIIWKYHNKDIDNDLQIDHIDANKLNNDISNLRLVTAQENSQHREVMKCLQS